MRPKIKHLNIEKVVTWDLFYSVEVNSFWGEHNIKDSSAKKL